MSDDGMLALYREALERLADEDTCILGEGLGGGPQEELHVRASFAAHTLGRDTCGCTECQVSLGLEPDDDYPDVSGGGVPYPPARTAHPDTLAERYLAATFEQDESGWSPGYEREHMIDAFTAGMDAQAAVTAAAAAQPASEDLGRVAYEAYAQWSDGKSLVTGQPLPAWDDMPEEIRMAWRVTAGAVWIAIDQGQAAARPAPLPAISPCTCGHPLYQHGDSVTGVRGYCTVCGPSLCGTFELVSGEL